MTRAEIRAQAMNLPAEERMNLAIDLWDSIEPDEIPPPSPAMMRLLDERIREHEANPDDVVPWRDVVTALQKKLHPVE